MVTFLPCAFSHPQVPSISCKSPHVENLTPKVQCMILGVEKQGKQRCSASAAHEALTGVSK
jgi:hypothetical protein